MPLGLIFLYHVNLVFRQKVGPVGNAELFSQRPYRRQALSWLECAIGDEQANAPFDLEIHRGRVGLAQLLEGVEQKDRVAEMARVVAPRPSRYCIDVNPLPCTATSAYTESPSRFCLIINTAFRCSFFPVPKNAISAVSVTSPFPFFHAN
jgi:hypothetical protein